MLYLQMDGVDDVINGKNFLTVTAIEMDILVTPASGVLSMYFDLRNEGSMYFANFTDGTDGANTTTNLSSIKMNGSPVTNKTAFIPDGTRVTLRVDLINPTNSGTHAFFNGRVGGFAMQGNIYSIKEYNGATLVAHYDMSTGTVQDQSGNGNHATLTGGTWVDDGTGGGTEPVGVDVSYSYGMQQKIYADRTTQTPTVQNIYADRQTQYPIKQAFYANRSWSYPLQQTIYADMAFSYALKQKIWLSRSWLYPLEQLISNEYATQWSTLPSVQTTWAAEEEPTTIWSKLTYQGGKFN